MRAIVFNFIDAELYDFSSLRWFSSAASFLSLELNNRLVPRGQPAEARLFSRVFRSTELFHKDVIGFNKRVPVNPMIIHLPLPTLGIDSHGCLDPSGCSWISSTVTGLLATRVAVMGLTYFLPRLFQCNAANLSPNKSALRPWGVMIVRTK